MSAHSKKARNVAAVSGGALVVAAPFLTAGTAQAATYTVTNLDDTGAGSLRQAIDDANGNSGPDTITFQAGLTGTIDVQSLMKITDSTTIQGPGASVIAVDGGDSTDIFYVYNQAYVLDVTFSGITISNADGGGGGIFNYGERLVLDSVVMTGNSGTYGAALYMKNEGDEEATLTIRNSTISGNTSTSRGGAIYINSTASTITPVIVIENSTFSGNTSGGGGGAIYLYGSNGPTLITNSTFTGNSADRGGALYLNDDLSDVVIANSTFTGNTATSNGGGALYVDDALITITNSILAGNTAATGADDLHTSNAATFNVNYSIVGEASDPLLGDVGNVTATDPMLGALANNGGPTQTMLPLAGSPAINAGDPAFAAPPATDQRGQARVFGGRIDIGAVEVGAVPEIPATGGSNGLMAGLGTALLGIGGILHLSGRRKRTADQA